MKVTLKMLRASRDWSLLMYTMMILFFYNYLRLNRT